MTVIALLFALFLGLRAPVVVCEQWFIDTDGDPATGYSIGGIGAEVLVDVHGDTRSVWGGLIPAEVRISCGVLPGRAWRLLSVPTGTYISHTSPPGPLPAVVEVYDCDAGCVNCVVSGGFPSFVDYGCDGAPAERWAGADTGDLRHMAEWINCFGR